MLFSYQERLIFHPEDIPDDYLYDFPWEFEEMYFEPRRGISLNAVLFKANQPKGLVLFFHGNSGSIASWGEVAKEVLENGYHMLMYDYRGFGKSTGKTILELPMHKDAEFIYGVLRDRYPDLPIVLFGQSLGTGIASRLASRVDARSLILITPYFNFTDVVRFHYPFLPVRRLLKYTFNNNRYLADVKCPVHIIHGTKDEMIPYESSIRLNAINDEFVLTTINGGNHGNLQQYEEYQRAIEVALS